jgi:glycosyltransferase involved in cell wall biosynthesis
MVLIEALSYGCPIISYDCQTGPRDIVINNNNGFLIEDSNESDFIRQFMVLIESDSLREEFQKEALIMREKFERDCIIDKWQTII